MLQFAGERTYGLPGITELLIDWNRGDKGALDRLMPLVYGELRNVARR